MPEEARAKLADVLEKLREEHYLPEGVLDAAGRK